jgi:hypothetical protein
MTLPKITKTHRWDRKLIARVEDLAQRTGRPVQHILDDAITIGLAQIEERMGERMRTMTPAEAWEAYVGSQTPAEFWRISQEQGATTYYEAAERYARDLPQIFREDWAEMEPGDHPDLDRIAFLLAEYLEEHAPGVYQAWLGAMLMGEGPTEEAAIEAAVRLYEETSGTESGYAESEADVHLFKSREELVAKLDVSLTVREDE